MNTTHIYSAGHVLGESEVSTSDLLDAAGYGRFEIPSSIIEDTMGISHVRHCPTIVKPGTLALAAARRALEKSPVSIEQIDMVLYCGIERDLAEPATAHFIANNLGIRPRHCFDVSSACHGFTDGLQVAMASIASGRVRYALVSTGECSSAKAKLILDYFQRGKLSREHAIDALGAFALGDAGGAMVVGISEDGSGVKADNTENRSDLRSLCFWDNFGAEHGRDPTFGMKMAQICARTINLVQKLIPPTLDKLQWDYSDIDLLIPHQVGRRPFEKYLDLFQLKPEQSLATYKRFGNLTSATIPVCWDIMSTEGRISKGKRIYVVSTGSGVVVSHLGIVA